MLGKKYKGPVDVAVTLYKVPSIFSKAITKTSKEVSQASIRFPSIIFSVLIC